MNKLSISIAKQYSEAPAGRHSTDGPYSGERFRDEFLYPALSKNDTIEVNLDGTLGYGSSFLEEAFGGLIRKYPLTLEQLKSKLVIISERPIYKIKIWDYLNDAELNKKNG